MMPCVGFIERCIRLYKEIMLLDTTNRGMWHLALALFTRIQQRDNLVFVTTFLLGPKPAGPGESGGGLGRPRGGRRNFSSAGRMLVCRPPMSDDIGSTDKKMMYQKSKDELHTRGH